MVATSRFPPSFDGNPWTYGSALFSLTLISAISLTILVGYALDARAKRAISQRLENYLVEPVSRGFTPLTLHRLIVSGFLLTVFVGAFPDVLLMLAWGEASDDTIELFFLIDRIGDALAVFPFVCAATLTVWAGQAVDHRLALDSVQMKIRPSWRQLRDRLKTVGIVSLIAIGVTLAKYTA